MGKVRRYGMTVVTMASVATVVLLVTGWGSAVAASVSSVLVTNDAAHAVPVAPQGTAKVQEQNTDASGNLKVHEQGTASVNVTNATLAVTQQPATDGGQIYRYDCTSDNSIKLLGQTYTATALSIVGTAYGEAWVNLRLGNTFVASIPAWDGLVSGTREFQHDIALSRPISFDRFDCRGLAYWEIGWIGNSP